MSLLLALTGGGGPPTLTGTATVAGAGTLKPVTAAVLAGLGAATGQGPMGPVVTVALTGVGAAAGVGTLTVGGGGGDVTVALTGVGAVAGVGTLSAVPQPSTGKSHTDLYIRQMLVDYYTKAFEKKFEESIKPDAINPDTGIPVSAKKRKVLSLKKTPEPTRVAEAVARAEPTLQNTPEIVVADLIDSALKFNALVFDFEAFAAEQRQKHEQYRRQREDDELLLFMSVL
jgi:hypothetical protein